MKDDYTVVGLTDPIRGSSEPNGLWTLTNVGEATPEILSPLCWSLWGTGVEFASRAGLYDFGALPPSVLDRIPGPAVLARDGETFSLKIDGDQSMSGTICSSLWLSMADGLPYGVMNPQRAYSVSWAQVRWGEETGQIYIERSNPAGPDTAPV